MLRNFLIPLLFFQLVSFSELQSNIRETQNKHNILSEHKKRQMQNFPSSGPSEEQKILIKKIDIQLDKLKAEESKATEKRKRITEILETYPFLKRVRSSTLKINISAATHDILTSIFAKKHMIPLGALAQTKCNMEVEERDPSPYVPAVSFSILVC